MWGIIGFFCALLCWAKDIMQSAICSKIHFAFSHRIEANNLASCACLSVFVYWFLNIPDSDLLIIYGRKTFYWFTYFIHEQEWGKDAQFTSLPCSRDKNAAPTFFFFFKWAHSNCSASEFPINCLGFCTLFFPDSETSKNYQKI